MRPRTSGPRSDSALVCDSALSVSTGRSSSMVRSSRCMCHGVVTSPPRRFFTAALAVHGDPSEVVTDRAAALANVIEELLPAALHNTGQHENNRVECEHGRLKARLKADAWAEDRSDGERSHPGARLHPEPTPQLLRTCSRRRAAVPAGHRIRRTQTRYLTSTGPQSPWAWPAIEQRNRASSHHAG